MKKQFLSFSAALFVLVFSGQIIAQNTVNIGYTSPANAPIIDGDAENFWDTIPENIIDVAFLEERVSLTASATWQMAWDNKNIYVLVNVNDDDFYPANEANTASWLADKVELYFDVNDVLADGGGPSQYSIYQPGHYQITDPFFINEDILTEHNFAFTIDNDSSGYLCEYSIPFSSLIDNNKEIINPFKRDTIGFDLTIIDLDEADKGENVENTGRVNWSNDGSKGESWNNMDDAGFIVFKGGTESKPIDTTFISATITNNEVYEFFSEPLINSGVYNKVLVTKSGCDSVISLSLTVNFDYANNNNIKYVQNNLPQIDGKIDSIWYNIPRNVIKTPMGTENVSLKENATWQAVWSESAIFILVNVPDDNFYPSTESGEVSWLSDLVELYFDMNDTIIDGEGAVSGNGHHQFATSFEQMGPDAPFWHKSGYTIKNDSYYICEYAIPFNGLTNKDNEPLNPAFGANFGFDITIIDLDEEGYGNNITMGRINYSNDGSLGDSWSNMDQSAKITLVGDCSVIETTEIEESICNGDSFDFNGAVLVESGVYTDTLKNEFYCDSIIELSLSVKTIKPAITVDGPLLTVSPTDASYQWVKCNETMEEIEGATESTFTATENGDYSVIVTDGNCSETAECVNVTGISINDVFSQNSINLFPNPANSELNISIDTEYSKANITVYNLLGKAVLTRNSYSEQLVTLNINDFENGLYIVNVTVDNNTFNYQVIKK